MDGVFYDALETRDPAEREAALMAALPRVIAAAKEHAPAYRERLAKVRPEDVTDRRALVDLPLTRKSDLIEMQRRNPPFGGLAAVPVAALARIFASPGPIYEPEARRPDFFRMARALVRRRHPPRRPRPQHVFLPPDPGRRDGRERGPGAGLPGDPGRHRPDRTAAAHDRRSAPGRLCRHAVLSENPARPRRRARASISGRSATRWSAPRRFRRRCGPSSRERGIAALQCYGTADLGLIAYESREPDGALCEGMLLDEGIIVEIVHPGTGEPAAPDEVGEVVVTTLTPEYPLIRFATGDLSAYLAGASPCGRTNHRIRGWLGRADQSVKVRGMFVHPVQIAEIMRRHKSIIQARLVVERPQSADEMTLLVEIGEPDEPEAAIAATLQAVTKLRGAVQQVPEGSLPNDGKIIDDRRPIG